MLIKKKNNKKYIKKFEYAKTLTDAMALAKELSPAKNPTITAIPDGVSVVVV